MARAPGPLCQTSCRLNRIGTLGAQEDESGSIRTSVQKSGSCEAVATGEAVDALVYLILGVAGDGILYLTVDASGTIGTNGAANQYTSLNVTLWADPRNDAGSPSATEADGATFSNGMANDIVLATGTLVSASMSIDPTTMTRSAIYVESMTPTLAGTLLLGGSIASGSQLEEQLTTPADAFQAIPQPDGGTIDLVNGGSAVVTLDPQGTILIPNITHANLQLADVPRIHLWRSRRTPSLR